MSSVRLTLFVLGILIIATLPILQPIRRASAVEPTPVRLFFPIISNPCPTSATPAFVDPRVGPNSDPILYPRLQFVRIIPVALAYGQTYWRVISVRIEGLESILADHSIYAKVIDANCQHVSSTQARIFSGDGTITNLDEQAAGDPCNCDFAFVMFGDSYSIRLRDAYESEAVEGMCLCGISTLVHPHVNFRITFQQTTFP